MRRFRSRLRRMLYRTRLQRGSLIVTSYSKDVKVVVGVKRSLLGSLRRNAVPPPTQEICLPLLCWTYRRPSTRSIVVFFCIDSTPPIRSCTGQTGYSKCESDLLPHYLASWCVVYTRAPSLVSYFSFCTAATCS